jgi:hypothetical protein
MINLDICQIIAKRYPKEKIGMLVNTKECNISHDRVFSLNIIKKLFDELFLYKIKSSKFIHHKKDKFSWTSSLMYRSIIAKKVN